jgi:ABC-type multidrug transport system ATPase subunit
LNEGAITIPTAKGKLNAIKRGYLTIIREIPLIGAKKSPFKALKGISLEFETGMIGLLGPNGAGKSTLMRIVCGILEQSYGKIFINGIDTTLKREELQGLIGYLPQEFGMYENMTAYKFLDYMALLKNVSDPQKRAERIEYVLQSVHLWERRNENIGSYSGGMKQRIGIAMILLHLPRILVVDEPTAGLDPGERIRFRNLLVELSRERVVLFSTHIIEDISSSCNRVAVMYKGNLKYWGTPVNMIKTAEGKVWQADIPEKDFEKANKQFRIVHHIKRGQKAESAKGEKREGGKAEWDESVKARMHEGANAEGSTPLPCGEGSGERSEISMVHIRCLSNEKPFETATATKPLLEDAYLLMLGGEV